MLEGGILHYFLNCLVAILHRPRAWCQSVMANPTNVLASGIEITGSIKFSNDMVIDGKVDGEITSEKGRGHHR